MFTATKKTALDTPEVEWRQIYGVVWNGHTQPLCDYEDLSEAMKIADALGGHVMVRWEGRSAWGDL